MTDEPTVPSSDSLQQLPLNCLDRNPYQTRTVSFGLGALDELAASIRAVGLLQPIVVRPVAGGRYQVIAGERRLEAVRILRLPTIAAIVRPVSDQQALEMTIVENLQRIGLTCMEEARGYDRLAREFGLTQEQMAQRTGKDRSSVANFLRLLNLPPGVQVMLEQGELTFGHAKVLMRLEAPEAVEALAQRIVKQPLSVRQTERAVSNLVRSRRFVEAARILYPNLEATEQELQRALGVSVAITWRRGRTRIVLECATSDDFDRILALMMSPPR
jgi:ParB family transcriptional regulator, chromosome partitioning protein